jgi:hypothetical protein
MAAEMHSGLVDAFHRTLQNDAFVQLVKEYAELGFDAVLDPGAMRDIPVVNSIFALFKVSAGVREALLIKKLLSFLADLSLIPAPLRLRMVERLERDPAYAQKVGEHVIELLDRIESHKKPGMVARVFRAYAEGRIDREMLQRLHFAIERVPLFELPHLRQFGEALTPADRLKLSRVSLEAFVASGLSTVASGYGALAYDPTPVCDAFLDLRLDE